MNNCQRSYFHYCATNYIREIWNENNKRKVTVSISDMFRKQTKHILPDDVSNKLTTILSLWDNKGGGISEREKGIRRASFVWVNCSKWNSIQKIQWRGKTVSLLPSISGLKDFVWSSFKEIFLNELGEILGKCCVK